jgi:predicted O-methyltransferase YrrM
LPEHPLDPVLVADRLSGREGAGGHDASSIDGAPRTRSPGDANGGRGAILRAVDVTLDPEPYSMLQWATVESARINGSEFVLARHGDDWVVRVDQRVLMSNRAHDSEIALADRAIEQVEDPRTVLVGGLGLGYTLRAVLDAVPETASVTVAEFVPEIVDWNRRILGALTDHPLADPRVTVVVGDVYDIIRRSRRAFDVILLDVDNGPQALSQVKNQRIYSDGGVRACNDALTTDGVLGVWSAGPNAKFARRLERMGFAVEVLRVPARLGGGAKHVLFLGRRQTRR